MAAVMAERVRWQLDGWLTGRTGRLPGALTHLVLVPDEVVPDRGRQLGFWGGETEAGQRAARALARIQGLLGPEAVHTARLRGGRDPADRVTLVPTSDAAVTVPDPAFPDPAPTGTPGHVPGPGAAAAGVAGAVPWPGQVPAPAPAIVYAEPLPAEVVDAGGAPVAVDGRGLLGALPSRVRIQGRSWAAVTAWAGPWLVDERWWDPAAHRRLVRLQATTDQGAAYLLRLAGGRWWVEAIYD
jgi:protein ImuB